MDALITRRQTLQSLACAAVFGGSLWTLAGCGGSGGDRSRNGGVSTGKTRVLVELPSGFPLPLSELKAGTAFGSSKVKGSGFDAKVNADAPTFAFLRHEPTGKFVLFGLVGPGRPGLTPLASAAAAMAVYFGWTGFSGAALTQALALLESNADVQALGTAIETAIATDPHAITDGNAAVAAAMKTTIERLGEGSAREIERAATAMRAAPRDSAPPLIQVQPSDELSGARVEQGEDGFVVPANLKRRPVAFYTYLTGHDPASSSAIARVDTQDVLPTGTIIGQIASLNERPAFGPVAGKPVALPTTGDDDRTFYETIALMGTFDNAAGDPGFFGDPKYAGEVAAWRSKLEELRVYSCFHSVGADVFNAAALGGGAVLYYSAAQAIRAQITLIASDASALVLARAQSGLYGEYVKGLMEAISQEYYQFYTSGSTAWRRVGLRLVGLAEKEAETAALGEAGATIASIAFLFAAALAAAGGVLATVDLGASYFDTLTSPLGVRWTETSLKARVRLSPATGTVPPDGSITLSTALVGLGGTTGVTYRYSLSGSDLANLGDGKGKIGRSFDTDSSTVNLVTLPSTQGDLVVTVEAFRGGASLGKATSTISVAETKPYTIETFYGSGDGRVIVSLGNDVLYQSEANSPHGPFALAGAKAGDTVRIELSGSTTRFAGLGTIYYDKPDGTRVKVFEGQNLTSPYPNPQFTPSFTLEA